MNATNTERICPHCGEPVPAERGPLAIYCSEACQKRAARRRYRAAHRAEIREYQSEYDAKYSRAHKAEKAAYGAKYHIEHRAEVAEYGAKWREDHPNYDAWKHMIHRCTDPKDKGFHHYGGRGIRVCTRWLHSYEAFEADILALLGLGPRPAGKSFDRIENDGPYAGWNVRWATPAEQANNRRPRGRGLLESQPGAVAYYAQFVNADVAPPPYAPANDNRPVPVPPAANDNHVLNVRNSGLTRTGS